jgi:hypothetical protein
VAGSRREDGNPRLKELSRGASRPAVETRTGAAHHKTDPVYGLSPVLRDVRPQMAIVARTAPDSGGPSDEKRAVDIGDGPYLPSDLNWWEPIKDGRRLDMQILPTTGTSNSPLNTAEVTYKMVPWPACHRPHKAWRVMPEQVQQGGPQTVLGPQTVPVDRCLYQ